MIYVLTTTGVLLLHITRCAVIFLHDHGDSMIILLLNMEQPRRMMRKRGRSCQTATTTPHRANVLRVAHEAVGTSRAELVFLGW